MQFNFFLNSETFLCIEALILHYVYYSITKRLSHLAYIELYYTSLCYLLKPLFYTHSSAPAVQIFQIFTTMFIVNWYFVSFFLNTFFMNVQRIFWWHKHLYSACAFKSTLTECQKLCNFYWVDLDIAKKKFLNIGVLSNRCFEVANVTNHWNIIYRRNHIRRLRMWLVDKEFLILKNVLCLFKNRWNSSFINWLFIFSTLFCIWTTVVFS